MENNDRIVKNKQPKSAILGIILIVAGILFLIDIYIPHISGKLMFPIILITIGSLMVLKQFNKRAKGDDYEA